jgi:hypothetical protein
MGLYVAVFFAVSADNGHLKLRDAGLASIHSNQFERPLLRTDFQTPNSSPVNKPDLFRNDMDKRLRMLQSIFT